MTQRILVRTLIVGQLGANCYVVEDRKSHQALIIDPGDAADYIERIIADSHLIPSHLIATHGHFDHILAAYELQQAYGIPLYMHEADNFLLEKMNSSAQYFLGKNIDGIPPKIDVAVSDETVINFGNCKITVIHSPGHTPGSICVYLIEEGLMFTGDTIFAHGQVGRTDFSYSSTRDLTKSIKKITAYPDKVRLLPGHGEATTVALEKRLLF